ncbi:MAG: YtxH domain-containing protein [Candidatus Saccharibacteria bacterium]
MKKGKFALGALIGAAAGLVAGIITAPKSGKETRADIKKKAIQAKDMAIKDAKFVAGKADEIIDQAKVTAKDISKEAKNDITDLKERADYAIKGAKKGFFDKK